MIHGEQPVLLSDYGYCATVNSEILMYTMLEVKNGTKTHRAGLVQY